MLLFVAIESEIGISFINPAQINNYRILEEGRGFFVSGPLALTSSLANKPPLTPALSPLG